MPLSDLEAQAERFAEALLVLEQILDWELLGQLYCHEGGEGFFPPAAVDAQRETGLLFAADLAQRLEQVSHLPARSLYVGAALFELAPMLCETLVLGREVHALSPALEEVAEIQRAFDVLEQRLELALPRIVVGALPAAADGLRGPFSHVWMTSVLSDPEAFPALHDHLYGRTGAAAAGGGDLERETRHARALLGCLLERTSRPALWTTTDEELELLRPQVEAYGLQLGVPAQGRLSGIVGDVVRITTIT